MIELNGCNLYNTTEMTEMLHTMIFDLSEDEQIDMYITDKHGEICDCLFVTRKQIINNDVVFFGNEKCFDNLKMFSLDEEEEDYITISDIRSILCCHGYIDRDNYFTMDDIS